MVFSVSFSQIAGNVTLIKQNITRIRQIVERLGSKRNTVTQDHRDRMCAKWPERRTKRSSRQKWYRYLSDRLFPQDQDKKTNEERCKGDSNLAPRPRRNAIYIYRTSTNRNHRLPVPQLPFANPHPRDRPRSLKRACNAS
jgi:hypothetical protein